MQDYKIEKLSQNNLSQVAKIDKECFGDNSWSYSLYLDELSDPQKYYKVACDKAKVIGYGGFSHIIDEAHIMNIAVTSSYRSKGVGSLILNSLIQQARDLKIKAMTLEVNQNNIIAIDFYKKNDFEIKGIRPKYYSNKDSALILWRFLEE